MILSLSLPKIMSEMTTAQIQIIYPAEGSLIISGGKLLDLQVDLSLAVTHDCPPLSFHRIALREKVWLRRILAPLDEELGIGTQLALFSTQADESLDVAPERELRTSIASILKQVDPWS